MAEELALYIEKIIETQGLKLKIVAIGKTKIVNDRGAQYEIKMMNDISSECPYFCSIRVDKINGTLVISEESCKS